MTRKAVFTTENSFFVNPAMLKKHCTIRRKSFYRIADLLEMSRQNFTVRLHTLGFKLWEVAIMAAYVKVQPEDILKTPLTDRQSKVIRMLVRIPEWKE